MRYNRTEPFRFIFDKQPTIFFSITGVDEKEVKTPEGIAQLIDLSPGGLKLKSNLDIAISTHHHVKVSVRFTLNGNEYHFNGNIKWRKKDQGEFYYGVKLLVDESAREELIKQLKIFSKSVKESNLEISKFP